MLYSLLRQISALLIVGTTLLACGGSEPATPKSPRTHRVKPMLVEDDGNKAEVASPDCHDGSCFACGPGFCIPGFFCDESSSQPSCQWLSKCGRATSCECLTESLGNGCSCAERNGGIFVKCQT